MCWTRGRISASARIVTTRAASASRRRCPLTRSLCGNEPHWDSLTGRVERAVSHSAGRDLTGRLDRSDVGSELHCYRSRLARGGRMVTVGLSAHALAAIAASSVHGSRRIRTFSANPGSAVLDELADHVTSGALRPAVHRVYPLADIAAAHEAFERGGVLGKHVLAISG
jgi:D-arabinose 1-dehydrogenase-like Zn-dependent alcohol dehydrogenase